MTEEHTHDPCPKCGAARFNHAPGGSRSGCTGFEASDALLDELVQAKREAAGERDCPACDAILSTTGITREALREALAGTIGVNKLPKILSRHGYTVGRRTIERHRREDHQP
jgi:hypothetical protein